MSKNYINSTIAEQYLLAEDKEQYINSLVKGTKERDYLEIQHLFNTKQQISEQDKKVIQEFTNKYSGHGQQTKNSFELRQHLLEFTTTSDEKRKEEIIETLQKDFFKISFNFQKPTLFQQTAQNQGKEAQKYETKLDQSLFDFDKFLTEKAYKKNSDFSLIRDEALSRIDFSKITFEGDQSAVKDKKLLESLQQIIFTGQAGDKIVEIIEKWVKLQESINKQQYVESAFYEKLTLEELKKLGSKLSFVKQDFEYCSQLLTKTFSKQLQIFTKKEYKDFSIEEKNQLKQLYSEIREWAKNDLHTSMYSLSDLLLTKILKIDDDLEQHDEKLFIQYLENTKNIFHHIHNDDQIKKRSVSQHQNFENRWFTCIPALFDVNEEKLIQDYVYNILKKDQDPKKFQKFFKSEFINKKFALSKLHQTGDISDVQKLLSVHEIEQETKSRQISIISSNKNYFKPGDDISLLVDIKNISDLAIKVFEINTENYYITNKSSFDNSISLEGINPLDQQASIKLSENPLIIKRHKFEFQKLSQAERGIFVIEFLGNGISSRAVIRKGGLSVLKKNNLSGHVLTIVNESNEVCCPNQEDPQTGIWLNGRFIKANNQGQVIIPYSQSIQSSQIIVVHNSFAELNNIDILTEQYTFKAAYLYHPETFLRANKAKIIVQPRLFINEIPCNMKLIENPEITAILTNEQNIPNTYTFKNLKLSAQEDLEIEIPVQNLVQNIEIKFDGKIKKLNGEFQNIQDRTEIQFSQNLKTEQFTDLYLSTNQQGYVLNVLGKNGEARPNMTVKVSLTHKLIIKTFDFTLQTDSNGQVQLGQLNQISKIEVNLSQTYEISQVQKFWIIGSRNQVQYPSEVNLTESDILTLPALSKEITPVNYSLYEVVNYVQVLNNCIGHIAIDNNRLVIYGLKEGTYTLKIKELSHVICINVIKGEYWKQNPAYIISHQDGSFRDRTSNIDQNLKILDCKLNDQKNKVDIQLLLPENVANQKNALDMVRVHAFAYNFSTEDVNEMSILLKDIQNDKSIETSQFGLKRSVFLNNKTLGDEICYVLERRNQKKYIGNTLEKPNILLKKTFVRDTQFDKENLSKDQEYSQGLQDRIIHDQPKIQHKKMARMAHEKEFKHLGGHRSLPVVDKGVNLMLNFLENSCKTYTNLKPNQQGQIEIADFEGDKYSQIYLVVTNLEATVSDNFNLKVKSLEQPKFRDLRLKSNLQKFQPFSEKRATVTLKNGQHSVIKSDTENIIIDNLQQFFDIQKQVRITQHQNDNQNNGYQFWSFLTDWNQYSNEKKMEKYDEFACHEVNIFIYIKDKEFFEQVVKPFLANKIEKSFVDYFLLDDKKVLDQYAQTHQLSQMNYMEQCLLISYLAKNGNQQKAKTLACALTLQAKQNPLDTNLRKRLYDTVISAQSKAPTRIIQQDLMEEQRVECESMARPMQTFGASYAMNAQPQVMHLQSKQAMPRMAAMSRGGPQMESAQMSLNCMSFAPQAEQFQSLSAQNYDQDLFERQVQQRQEYKPGYEKLKKTKEYVERTYYEIKNPEQQKTLIKINLFWENLAHYTADNAGNLDQFISENFIYASSNHAEMVLVLAFTALPFKGGDFTLKAANGRDLMIQAGKTNLIVFLKDITLCEFEKRGDITVSQMFFDPKDRFKYLEDDPTVKVEKEVDEFISNKVYGIQTIITNCSIAQSEFQILVEIPEGSIPVQQIDYTKATTLSIDSYHTEKIQTFFYFPAIGKFNIIPASVSRNEKVLAYANDLGQIEVKIEKEIKKMETFTDIIKNGKQEDILQFINEKNILNSKIFRFSDIYWLVVQDKNFFSQLIQILQDRQIFDYQIWLFGLHHKCPKIFAQLLQNHQFMKQYLLSQSRYYGLKNLHIQNHLEINNIQFFEYHPLLSQRVHKFMNEEKSTILNQQLKQTYQDFLLYMLEVPQLSAEQLLVWAYYLLLQERIEESINIFKRIQRADTSSSQLQYDYMAAYLDIYQGKESNFKVAREISKKYDNYPILSWRNLFVELKNQLSEYDGIDVNQSEQSKETEMSKNLKQGSQEEQVSFEIEKKELIITHQNTSSFKLFFYEIDLEILFSRSPFLNNDKSDEFAYVKANYTENVKVKNSNIIETLKYQIPEHLVNKNLYVLLKYANDVQSLTYFSADLKVSVLQNYGQVKVMDANHHPLSRVYVKCFAQDKNGSENFYRDGYTDLRGRFDYALSSGSDIDNIEKFSLLISSEEFGSIIKEAKKPNTQGKMVSTLDY